MATRTLLGVALATVALAAGCGGTGDTASTAAEGPVTRSGESPEELLERKRCEFVGADILAVLAAEGVELTDAFAVRSRERPTWLVAARVAGADGAAGETALWSAQALDAGAQFSAVDDVAARASGLAAPTDGTTVSTEGAALARECAQ